MSQSKISFKIDKDLKKEIEKICDEMGMSLPTAFTIFAKKLLTERKIPFEIEANPFYSKKNLKRLNKSIKQMEKIK
ncbi:type II toxin-antitoxin system RelB/DinJ family antitoxin [Candidatus Cetobacterium colombiensis]|uniref:Type II toxin-antitoxin system RelB/DinJ family antitoxin n=1 Tax=Candidatus Cetobacterium colombiensis TaxID=3073100 RepID=A0ABU4WCD8_9FUSO|nr:type II toxin-antitoxin system RelB/DinJ family antitoxin [Candidatus Cetobacterium colombiensis]MDX8337215.1 type II toxin-antitoxin system RelB/DinJ family antitoxin [Candidatus Cetobacterium colombiensis]